MFSVSGSDVCMGRHAQGDCSASFTARSVKTTGTERRSSTGEIMTQLQGIMYYTKQQARRSREGGGGGGGGGFASHCFDFQHSDGAQNED